MMHHSVMDKNPLCEPLYFFLLCVACFYCCDLDIDGNREIQIYRQRMKTKGTEEKKNGFTPFSYVANFITSFSPFLHLPVLCILPVPFLLHSLYIHPLLQPPSRYLCE